MSFWEELYVSMLVSGTVWSGMSALALASCVRVEAGRHARGWAASFAVSTLCAAYCLGRLLRVEPSERPDGPATGFLCTDKERP